MLVFALAKFVRGLSCTYLRASVDSALRWHKCFSRERDVNEPAKYIGKYAEKLKKKLGESVPKPRAVDLEY